MDKPLLDLMSFFFLPEKGTVENENDFENILKPHLISKTEEGKKYDIQKVILEVEVLKKKHLESLNGSRPHGDLLAVADSFVKYCDKLLVREDNLESSTIKKEKFTIPQKIKILDQLNIKGWLQEKGYTIFQIEFLLSDLFDRTDKTIRDGFSNKKHEKNAKEYLEELKNLKAKH